MDRRDAHASPRIGAALEVVSRLGDEALVFKPAGLSSERGAGDLGDCLVRRAEQQFGWTKCWLPHRLDRPTRGLLMVAGSKETAARQSEEIRAGAWTKWYVARILDASAAMGIVGEHRAYLKRVGRLATVVRSGGDPSRLTIHCVAPALDAPHQAHALIRLDTGRFHQIRIMLANLGFPLVGDVEYGAWPTRSQSTEYPDLDLEAIALRIVRPGKTIVHRLAQHPARRGLAPQIDAALDKVLSEAGS